MKLHSVHRPLVLALVCAIFACESGTEEDIAAGKADVAAEAQAGGKADQADICAGWDWYDDDFCDDPYGWCAQPDPDCGPDGDSCEAGWTWSGRADEGCVPEDVPAPTPLAFQPAQVIGQRASTAFDVRAYAAVAVDAGGGVHAIYSDWGRRPTYARPDDGWTPHTLDGGAYVSEGLRITADQAVHVAYVDDHYRLQHLWVDDGAVVDREQIGTYVYSLGMALAGDTTHFVYGSGDLNNALVGRSGELDDATTQTIASFQNVTEAREGAAVAVVEGRVHTLYGTVPAAYNYHASQQLRYAVRDDAGSWTDALVPNATSITAALTVSGDGTPQALYDETVGGSRTLMLAELHDGAWDSTPLLGQGQTGRSPNLIAAADRSLHVVYTTAAHELIHWRRASDGTWGEPVVLDTGVSMAGEDRVSIALAPDGAVHVVYSDTQTREVRYVEGR